MNKLLAAAGMGAMLCSAMAFADPDPAKPPLANAIETVTENAVEHPGNKGLANATTRLQENSIKQFDKRSNHPPGQQKKTDAVDKSGGQDKGVDRAQVADRVDRPEKVDRPDKPDRPDRPDKPDRPDRSAHAGIDRPIPPGHNK